jgi:hypothetical protein
MARSRLLDPKLDLINDEGAVLWSIIQGEQLEFPISLTFVEDVTAGYTYEAVVVEGLNKANQTDTPTAVRPGGVLTQLNIRVPVNRGTWDSAQAYNREEVVYYSSKYYKLLSGVAYTNSTPPSSNSMWAETTLNKVYLQFPKTLSANWAVLAGIGSPAYGFFELRVTEPQDNIYIRTWKPIRGMVEILFSPTFSQDD